MRYPSLLISLFIALISAAMAAKQPNLLIITVDDMSADSLGIFGAEIAGTSPTIDQLARQGMRFNQAHVVVGNCFPSRNVMWSGIYPHNTGIEGFYEVRNPQHLHLADIFKNAGYYTGIFHKVSHSTPYSPYPGWNADLTISPEGKRRDIKAAQSYFDATKQGIAEAQAAAKPFCLVLNTSDPHKPFYAQAKDGSTIPDPNVPSRVFTPEEVPVPGFLFDDPVVRKELSHYYSSVRRADDCVAALMAALDESGERENTIIMFLSDHGMPLPFAKTQVYHHSSNTPLFFIVPGVTKPNTVDDRSLVSAVDLLPTLLELTGVNHAGKMDGHSFASLLRGGSSGARDFVVKEYNENSGGWRDPMRALQTSQYLYIFNPWSDGKRIMASATTNTPTYRQMKKLAASDPVIAARHDLYQHRVVEELYDIEKDPDCLTNLVHSPSHQQQLTSLQTMLDEWMVDTRDPMLTVFRQRTDPAVRAAYVKAQQAEADARRKKPRQGKS